MIPDPVSRASAQELMAAVLELHGSGLERIGAALEESGEAGAEIKQRLVSDAVVASLLLIHDLYPVPLADRVREALDGVRPYMESHGGDVEILAVEDGVARLRLQGSCDGCPASASTLELAIKQALEEAAPDLVGLEVEGVTAGATMPEISGTELPVISVDGGGGSGNGANGSVPEELPRSRRRDRAGLCPTGWSARATARSRP